MFIFQTKSMITPKLQSRLKVFLHDKLKKMSMYASLTLCGMYRLILCAWGCRLNNVTL